MGGKTNKYCIFSRDYEYNIQQSTILVYRSWNIYYVVSWNHSWELSENRFQPRLPSSISNIIPTPSLHCHPHTRWLIRIYRGGSKILLTSIPCDLDAHSSNLDHSKPRKSETQEVTWFFQGLGLFLLRDIHPHRCAAWLFQVYCQDSALSL